MKKYEMMKRPGRATRGEWTLIRFRCDELKFMREYFMFSGCRLFWQLCTFRLTEETLAHGGFAKRLVLRFRGPRRVSEQELAPLFPRRVQAEPRKGAKKEDIGGVTNKIVLLSVRSLLPGRPGIVNDQRTLLQ